MQPGQADFAPEGYEEYLYSAEKKGYSGTGCWCRQKPLNVQYGLGLEEHDHEGLSLIHISQYFFPMRENPSVVWRMRLSG